MEKENPVDIARKLWEDGDDSHTSFEEDLAFHLVNGMVFRWNEQFVFARPVKSNEPQYWESYRVYKEDECDAWFVWLGVGSAEELVKLFTSNMVPQKKFLIRKNKNTFKTIEIQKFIKIYGKQGKKTK